jgi:hypothetical protein
MQRLEIVPPSRFVTGEPCRMQVGRHVGEHPLDALVSGERLAELLPSLGVSGRRPQQLLRGPDAIGRPIDAAGIETLHGDGKAFAFLAEEVIEGHGQVLEEDLGMESATPAGHRDDLADAEAREPFSTTKAEIFGLAPASGCPAKNLNTPATGALVM